MKRFHDILFVAGLKVNDDAALTRTIELAVSNDARVTLLGVYPVAPENAVSTVGEVDININALLHEIWRKRLDELADRLRSMSVECEVLLKSGVEFRTIVQTSIERNHDLVVKTIGEPEGPMERAFNSVERHLMRKCECPVWLIRAGTRRRLRRIVAALGSFEPAGRELNVKLLRLGIAIARREQCELDVVHAWKLVGEEHLMSYRRVNGEQLEMLRRATEANESMLLEELVSQVRAEMSAEDVDIDVLLRKGDAHRVVPEFALQLDADLVLMGTTTHTEPGLLISSTAERVIDNIRTSLMTVKPYGFRSPLRWDD